MSKYGSLEHYRGSSYAGYLNYEGEPGSITVDQNGVVVGSNTTTLNFTGGVNVTAGPPGQTNIDVIGAGAVVMDNSGVPITYPDDPAADGVWYGDGTKAQAGGSALATVIGNLAEVSAEGTSIGARAQANGEGSVALGRFASSAGDYGVAAGYFSSAGSVDTVAIGNQTQATGNSSVGIGLQSDARGGSVAIGTSCNSYGATGVVLGYQAASTDFLSTDVIAVGTFAAANGGSAIAVGRNAAAESFCVGIGDTAVSSITDGVSIGRSSTSTSQSVSIGFATGSGLQGIAIGPQANCSIGGVSIGRLAGGGSYNTAVGFEAAVNGVANGQVVVGRQSSTADASGIAIGDNSTATGADSISMGRATVASAGFGVAIGQGCAANGDAVAIGSSATAGGVSQGVAIGYTANANSNAVAVGPSSVSTTSSVAIGESANTTGGINSIALGLNAAATNNDCIAIGNSSAANTLNSVAVGSFSIASNQATCVGYNSTVNNFGVAVGFDATGASSGVSIGRSAAGTGNFAVAIGQNASAGEDAIAIGNAAAAGEDSLAIGFSSVSTVLAGVAIGIGSNAAAIDRSFALNVNAASIDTAGAVPFLQCVVNGANREIPLAVAGGTTLSVTGSGFIGASSVSGSTDSAVAVLDVTQITSGASTIYRVTVYIEYMCTDIAEGSSATITFDGGVLFPPMLNSPQARYFTCMHTGGYLNADEFNISPTWAIITGGTGAVFIQSDTGGTKLGTRRGTFTVDYQTS